MINGDLKKQSEFKSCDSCDYYNHNCKYCTNADAGIPEEYFDRCPDDFYCKEYEPIKDKE